MRLRINTNKDGSQNFYVVKSYRNENNVSSTKIVEKLGTYAELLEKHPDPVAWAKEYVNSLNMQEKEKNTEITVRFSPASQIEKNGRIFYEGGYLFLQKIFYELRLGYICKHITEKYGLKYNLHEVLGYLVYGTILTSDSGARAYDYSQELLEKPEYKLRDMYRALDIIAEESSNIQYKMYTLGEKRKQKAGVLYYDCTNYYFEQDWEPGRQKHGAGRESSYIPPVQVGMFISEEGFPLAFRLNDAGAEMLREMRSLEKEILKEHEKDKLIICMDGSPIMPVKKFPNMENQSYIKTLSIRNLSEELQARVRDRDGWHLVGKKGEYNLDIITANRENYIRYYSSIFYKEEIIQEEGSTCRVIVAFSNKYMDYTRKIRNEQLARIRAANQTIRTGKTKDILNYKHTAASRRREAAESSAYALLERRDEEDYDGFYAVETDLDYAVEKIFEINSEHWEVVETFRKMKSDFYAQPAYSPRENRVLAHLTTCFIALTVIRKMKKRLQGKYTYRQIIGGLNEIRFILFPEGGYVPAYMRNDFTDDLHSVFPFRTDHQIIPKKEMEKIILMSKKKKQVPGVPE